MTEALGTPDKRISDWAYNAFAQRTRIKVNNPSQSTIIDYQYTYDAELNITQKTN